MVVAEFLVSHLSEALEMPKLVTTKGAQEGPCNICGDIGKLTEDHTPPKGCLKPAKVELNHIVRLLSDDHSKAKGLVSQNGVKYRTLCSRCNNTLLGTKYDPAFISFVNGVGTHLRSTLHLPSTIRVQAQPQAILRALLGHISAQGVNRYLKGPLTEPLRDYFLDNSKPLPLGIQVFYWAYPFPSHVMFRDAAYIDIPSGESFGIWLLKFFPIAFLIVWGEPRGLQYPIQRLDHWRDCPFQTQVDLSVSLRPIPPQYWPEAPSERSMILYGLEAVSVNG